MRFAHQGAPAEGDVSVDIDLPSQTRSPPGRVIRRDAIGVDMAGTLQNTVGTPPPVVFDPRRRLVGADQVVAPNSVAIASRSGSRSWR
jgi:hypothetical protein